MRELHAETLLAADGLVFGRDAALGGPVSFELKAGSITALLGRNGAGKSTLLDTLTGLLPKKNGRIERSSDFALVPQCFNDALGFTAFDIVLMGRARRIGLFSTPTKSDAQAAHRAIERLGLEHLAERPFRELSGGQQQLFVIARALAGDAPLIFFDEPTAALDLPNQQTVLKLMLELAREGRSILFTTHDPLHAELAADQVLLLMPGGRLERGPKDDMLTAEHIREAFGVRMAEMVKAAALTDGQPVQSLLVPDFEL